MLIRFNVKNFLSFGANADGTSKEFSMIAGKARQKKEHLYDDGNLKLTRLAAVYGANASGKSNLMKALTWFKRTVTEGELPDNSTEMYCKTDAENKGKPSYFEAEIVLDGKYYAYGFEVVLSRGEFTAEWLVELHSDNQEKVIFSRDCVKSEWDLSYWKSDRRLYERLNIYAEDISGDPAVLFLHAMNQSKSKLYDTYHSAKVLRDVYTWIRDSLVCVFPNEYGKDFDYLANETDMKTAEQILAAFGTGISAFEMVEVPPERIAEMVPQSVYRQISQVIEKGRKEIAQAIEMASGRPSTQMALFLGTLRGPRELILISVSAEGDILCDRLEFHHKNSPFLFSMGEESDGTVRLFDFLEILISGEGKTYVIDELDRALHPSLTYRFVELFFEMAAEKNIQLIFTTHESRLLDFDLLRRDEVWFTEKNAAGETDIYSLEEYNVRFDQKIDKAYLEGRYGGVPVFSTLFPVKEEP